MNNAYFLHFRQEQTNQIFTFQKNKQKLIKERAVINLKLKKIKSFNWLWFKRVIIKIISCGCINKNKQRNIEIVELSKELNLINRSIKIINKKIKKLNYSIDFLKSNYLQVQKLEINAISLQNKVLPTNRQSDSPKI